MSKADCHIGGVSRAGLALLLVLVLATFHGKAARADPVVRFAADGRLVRPEGYRQWVFIGAPITPDSLNGGDAYAPGFKHVYVDPKTFAHWQETGGFRQGAVVVQERVGVGSTREMSGNGFFPGRFIGLQVMIKDVKWFPKTIWGFFSFGKPPYADKVRAVGGLGELDCAGCHARAHQDWVFTEFYPVLKAARPQ